MKQETTEDKRGEAVGAIAGAFASLQAESERVEREKGYDSPEARQLRERRSAGMGTVMFLLGGDD